MDTPGLLVSGDTFAPNYSWIMDKDTLVSVPVVIDHAAADATLPAGYPAGTLRSGLVLGKVTVGGAYKEYDDADADGTQTAVGVLLHPIRLRDPFGNTLPAGQKVFGEMVVGGKVNSSLLLGLDANGLTDLQALKTFIFGDLY